MDNPRTYMDNPIIVNRDERIVRRSYFHTPGKGYRNLFHSVLRAGHEWVAPRYALKSLAFPGHDLVLSVSGTGIVKCAQRSFPIRSGDLCWADCRRHVLEWPERARPWEFMWIRVDSPQLDAIAQLLKVGTNPVFTGPHAGRAGAIFRKIFGLLSARPVIIDPALHAEVSALIALLFELREATPTGKRQLVDDSKTLASIATVLNTMRMEYARQWRAEDLAQLAGISAPQFFRRFRQATGSSPMDWLRRERANHAKRWLAETHEPIRDIAEEVGYRDPLYFSRDFKKLVGVSPADYRRQEHIRMRGPQTPGG